MPTYRQEDLYADVAQVQHENPDQFGSGRLIGRNLILTARHLVERADGSMKDWRIRLFGAKPKDGGPWDWREADIVWVGKDKLDIALLEVRSKADAPDLRPKLSLRGAKIVRVIERRVVGLGFPLGAKSDGMRQLMTPVGGLTDENHSTLTWGINQSYIPQAPDKDWPGFSGASVRWARKQG